MSSSLGCDRALFDASAADYDRVFTDSFLGKYYRNRVQEYCQRAWPNSHYILELNAGTGEDAIFLASLGNRVMATDISQNMLTEAGRKARNSDIGASVETRHMAIEDLAQLDGLQCDGILSNFGGLNCIEHIEKFAADAAQLLTPGKQMLLCVMGPYVLWEWCWYGIKGNFKRAFRRLGGRSFWNGVPIYYHHPKKFIQALEDQGFHCVRQEAIGIATPPSYVNTFILRHPWLFSLLDRLEGKISKYRFLSAYADHYLLMLEKR